MRQTFETSPTSHRHRSSGFTLLEVLIASIIAGAALAILIRAAEGGLSATRTAARYEEAVVRARSHLDAALHGTVLAPRDNQGDDGGGFRWRVRVAPSATTAPGAPAAAVTLYAVSVWIAWHDGGKGRDVRLDTLQVGAGRR
jgi:general secretion pathway protein I